MNAGIGRVCFLFDSKMAFKQAIGKQKLTEADKL
jgi:hypothetical protein